MNLNDLHLFLRVVETNSFTAAADALGIQKSTISRRIGQLEDELGVRLLQRTTRKLHLTDEGTELFERSRPLIDELEQLPDLVSANHSSPRGRLRVTMPSEMAAIILADTVADFMGKYPMIQLEVELSSRYVDLIEEGIDVAIRVGKLTDSSLIARKLGTAESSLYASPEYLSNHGIPKTPDDLVNHQCLSHFVTADEWAFDNWNDGTPVPINKRLKANNITFLKKTSMSGKGIARLADAFCYEEVATGGLVKVLEDYKFPMTEMHAVYPSRRHLNPKVRLFIDHILEFMQQQPWNMDRNKTSLAPALSKKVLPTKEAAEISTSARS